MQIQNTFIEKQEFMISITMQRFLFRSKSILLLLSQRTIILLTINVVRQKIKDRYAVRL